MSRRVSYEWTLETIDDVLDIVDSDFGDRLASLDADRVREAIWPRDREDSVDLLRSIGEPPHTFDVGVVRDVWDSETEDLIDRAWSYVEDGKLGECFEGGNEKAKVPARFHAELARFVKANGGAQ